MLKKRMAGLLVLPLALVLATGQVSAAKAANTGSVAGKVLISVDGAAATPLANVPVTLADSNYVSFGIGDPQGSSTSSATGEYSFSNLADGTYYAFVGALNTAKATSDSPLTQATSGEWYAKIGYYASSGYDTSQLFSRVTISGGAAVSASDFTLPGWASVGQISGSLLDDKGQPLDVDNTLGMSDGTDTSAVKEGVYVSLTNGYPIHHQYADLTGHFAFYLPAGTYLISFGDPEWGNPVFENGTTNSNAAPRLDLAAGAFSAGHNFVIKTFDLTAVGVSKAKITGQLKPGTDLKVTGLKVPAGASAFYQWTCGVDTDGMDIYLGQGAIFAVTIDAPLTCPSGRVSANVTLRKSGFFDSSFQIASKVKVVSFAKIKHAASSTKLVNRFPAISGYPGKGNILHGDNATFKLKSVTKVGSQWFRCPSKAAAQTARLTGCQQISKANNKRTYKITAYDAKSYLVYRVQVKTYKDSKIHGIVAPSDSIAFMPGYF